MLPQALYGRGMAKISPEDIITRNILQENNQVEVKVAVAVTDDVAKNALSTFANNDPIIDL